MTSTFSTVDPYVRREEILSLVGVATAITDKATGGSIGSAATTVDISSAINVAQATAGQTLTLPNPTNTALTTRFSVNNVGSNSFILLSTTIAPGAGINVVWTGSAYSVIGTSSGASNVTVTGGKSFTVNNTLTLAGTDATTMTFPNASDTVVTLAATQTLTNKTLTTPTLTTPNIGVATATTVNKVTVTAPASGSTLTILDGKTLTANNTLTLAGTDSTVMTFPSTSATIARTDAANTFTGVQTLSAAPVFTAGLTASGAVSNDFSGGTGTFKTSTGNVQLSGATTITDATTPSLTTAAGKTNTGFVQINGKTSGALKLIAADAAAQTVTVNLAAQTTGAGTLNIPDMAGATKTVCWLESPTLTTPVIGVATGTSLAVTGLISSSGTAGIGYATGAGGAVTQATDKGTGVTLSKVSGAITTANASLAGAASVSFTVTNTLVAATDVVLVSIKSGASTGLYKVYVTATAAGSFQITLTNYGSTAGEVVVINFVVIKAVIS